MKKILLFLLAITIILSCTTKTSVLTNYYFSNQEKVHQTADSLMYLVKKYNRDITIRKRYDLDSTIVFRQYFPEINSKLPIEFDKNFNRVDPFPKYTLNTDVSHFILKEIKGGIYQSIFVDSGSAFFGYKFYNYSKYELGVLIFSDDTKVIKENIIKKLSDNVCIYKSIIP